MNSQTIYKLPQNNEEQESSMMRTTLITTTLLISFLLVSCGARETEDENDSSQTTTTTTGGTGFGTGGGTSDTGDGSDESVAGLWDFSDLIEESYQYWSDDGTIVEYDYQGDGEGTSENCFELTEMNYTREGEVFNVEGVIQTVTRTDNTLFINGVEFPLIVSFSVIDLEPCI